MKKEQLENVILLCIFYLAVVIIIFICAGIMKKPSTAKQVNVRIENISTLHKMIESKELSEAEFDYIAFNDNDLKK